ncbi:GPI mannosyltransferase 1 [Colletes gigas]|uniref:GPI mannosyltransferase 1 n=1 Tax=Colletes gigas TaxID=935657 RepID=UPI001C9B71BA|nr:GPI mannosyltransferase 1 [Colletes gigas]XP_043253524.1 GPI mannosyltransferase 1 [Colletes gigas]XP_043253525.1 GPI mannosyltransferase 1 [Colletes gigas]
MDTLSFKGHCSLAFLLRVVLVVYSNYHDKTFYVPYTDVDYKVFTDAARYMVEGKSPFERDTYRYTPLLALLLTPNILLHQNFGKILFSFVDVLVAILIKKILTLQNCSEKLKCICAMLWLYNPFTIIISTRGNADSMAVLLVMLTLFSFLRHKFILTGLLHAISVHFRLYPIVFSLPMYISLNKRNLVPNKNQLKLVLSCVSLVILLTIVNYYFYGFEYLYNSLIYHVIRKDTKHNFSVYFYMLYLSVNYPPSIIEKIFTFLPQLMLLLMLSYKYSSKSELPFAMFTQSMVMVTYNPVLTSQYFFWFLSLLPLCLPHFRLSAKRSVSLCFAWIVSQGLWLLAAYFLEFRGSNTFMFIWISSLLFFVVNVKIFNDIIAYYKQ